MQKTNSLRVYVSAPEVRDLVRQIAEAFQCGTLSTCPMCGEIISRSPFLAARLNLTLAICPEDEGGALCPACAVFGPEPPPAVSIALEFPVERAA